MYNSSTGLRAPTTISAAFESAHLEDVQSRVPIPSLDQGLILHNIGQDLCDNDITTGSHCESSGLSDAVGPRNEAAHLGNRSGERRTQTRIRAPTGASLGSSQAVKISPFRDT
jgi:hypothetical protein